MKTSTPDSVPAVTAGGTVEDTADGVTGVNKWQRQEDVRKTQKLAAQLAEEARVARAKAAAERAKAVRTAEVAARRAETIKAAEQAATARANAAATAKARAGTPVLPASPGVKAWAGAQLTAMGYGPEQFTCLDHLFTRESGWNPLADNPNSDAYGIPQALPGSKMASAGPDWPTNPQTQIRWGLGYINARYGSPCLAWDHSQKHNWY